VRCSWIGIPNANKAAVLAQLGFAETDEIVAEDIPEFSSSETPSGWLIICAHESDWASHERVSALSAGGRAVGGQMTTVVMYSEGFEYRDGEQRWSVLHYLEDDKNLDVKGLPPPQFGKICDEAFRKEDEEGEADYVFDVPIDLSAAVCGFHPNEDMFSEPLVFKVLEPTIPQGKDGGLVRGLTRLFGRRK